MRSQERLESIPQPETFAPGGVLRRSYTEGPGMEVKLGGAPGAPLALAIGRAQRERQAERLLSERQRVAPRAMMATSNPALRGLRGSYNPPYRLSPEQLRRRSPYKSGYLRTPGGIGRTRAELT